MFLICLFLSFFMDAVSGAGIEERVMMEGDSVTLLTNLTEILNDDTILWMFGPKDFLIAQIARQQDLNSIYFTDDDRFRGRLQVDQNTGSLTLRNTRIKHSGQYKLSISRVKTTIKIFNVTVSGLAGETDGVKSLSVMEGDSVTLKNDVKVQRDDLMAWRFGDKGILLAKIDVETNEISLNDADERFRDRLKLDQTGSLTIMNTKTEHSGLYEMQIRGRESSQRFLLSVTDSGLSPGAIAGITVSVLLVAAVLAAVVVYYHHTVAELKKQIAAPQEKPVEEGESPTLRTDITELHDVTIQWYYGDEPKPIAEIKENKDKFTYDGSDGRFRSKLTLDEKTGSLTITDIRTIHTGLYTLKISKSRSTKIKKIVVSVKVNSESVKEGDHKTLQNNAKIQEGDLLLWMFGAEKSLVAIKAPRTFNTEERFKGRVKVHENGSLTISNIKSEEFGHYKLQIINSKQTTGRRFNLTFHVEFVKGEEGGSATLKIADKIQKDDLLLWMFGPEKSLVAIKAPGTYNTDKRFEGRVKVDENGSLTISNIRREEFRDYKLQIINGKQTTSWRVNLAADESVKEGEDKTLQNNAEIQEGDLLLWMFGVEKSLVAIKAPGTYKTEERFKGTVKMDENGSLTISNIKPEDFGHYKLQIVNSKETTGRRFNLTKYAVEPVTSKTPLMEAVGDEGEAGLQFEMRRHTHQC